MLAALQLAGALQQRPRPELTHTAPNTRRRAQTFGSGSSKVKQYHHYAYKMEAAPPFRICAVSKEIPLVTRKKEAAGAEGGQPPQRSWTHQRIWKDTSQTAYASGLFVDGDNVLLSYGSSDIDARLLAMSRAQVEDLFSEAPFDCSGSEVLDPGSGEAPGAAGNATAPDGGEETRRQHLRHKIHRRMHRRDRSLREGAP